MKRRFRTLGRILALSGTLALGLTMPRAAVAQFMAIQPIPGDPALPLSGEFPTAISPDGSIVVGTTTTGGVVGNGSSLGALPGNRPFRWVKGVGTTDPGVGPSNGFVTAGGVSNDGSVIVGNSFANQLLAQFNKGSVAYRWDATTGRVPIRGIPGTTNNTTTAGGVSGDGSVVVGMSATQRFFFGLPSGLPTFQQAYRWTQATGTVGLGFLPGAPIGSNEFSTATGISADGSVIVGQSFVGVGAEAFRWTQATGMTGLGFLPGASQFVSSATGVSRNGQFIVGNSYSANGSEAFLWDARDGMMPLGDLPGEGFSSTATVVTDNGTVYGNGREDTGLLDQNGNPITQAAFVWDKKDGIRDLKQVLTADGMGDALKGWTLLGVTGVSADGNTITGYGYEPGQYDANGQLIYNGSYYQGWVAHVTPEPNAWVSLVMGVGGIGVWRLRKQRRAI
jgi:probable HAF family extracellular repeat protein